VLSPLFMRLGNRARPFIPDGPKPEMGKFRNVTIRNVVATDVSEIGCAIAGLPNHPIENVSLNNITITFAGGGTKEQASAAVPEKPEAYPECNMFGILPAYGFYCRHIDGLKLKDTNLRTTIPDHRPAIICDDVKHVQIEDLNTPTTSGVLPLIKR